MSFERWRLNGWLVAADASLPEITQLFAVADREIRDASVEGVSADGRFMHAYDAALTLCTIAMRASGFRVTKAQGHHKRTIESLPFSLGAEFRAVADQVELASRLRGQAMYDRTEVAEDKNAEELIVTAKELRSSIIEWMQNCHPELLPARI